VYCLRSLIGNGIHCKPPPRFLGNNKTSGVTFIKATKKIQKGSKPSWIFNSYFKLHKNLKAHSLLPRKIREWKKSLLY